ncbi:MAG TPA: DNA ligase, partial [Chloroflexia bacterium]|nr:DNA ligase [Chloroflexia bacterium]
MPLPFQVVAETLEALEPISSRLQMIALLADLLGAAAADEIAPLCYLIQGRLAPEYRQREFGISEKLAVRAVAGSGGCTVDEVQRLSTDTGDVGLAALECRTRAGDASGDGLTLREVHSALSDIAAAEGSGSQDRKLQLLATLLNRVTPLAAKWLTRMVLGRLRVGVRDPTVLDALSQAKAGNKS